MSWLERFRLPFREDTEFALLLLMALVVPLVFSLYTYENFETIKFGFWSILVGCWLLFLFRRGWNWLWAGKVWLKAFLICLGIFLVTALVSALLAPDKLDSFLGFYYRFDNSFLFYGLWALLFLWLFKTLTSGKLRILLEVVAFDGVLMSLLGVLQSVGFAYYGGLAPSGLLRAPSFVGNPDFTAMFLTAVLPLPLIFFFESGSLKRKIYYGLGFFIIVWALVAFSSRGAWLAAAVSLVFGLVLSLIYKFPARLRIGFAGLLVFGVALGAVFFSVTRPGSWQSTLQLNETNVNLRFFVWDVARQAIAVKPWFGVGLGSFASFFEQHRGKNLSAQGGVFDDAHNLFLHLSATGGLLLTAAFLGLLAIALLAGAEKIRKQPAPLVLAMMMGVVGWAVAASFTPVAIPCFFILAVLLVALVLEDSTVVASQAAHWKVWRWPVLFAGLILVLGGLSFLTAEHLFYAGYNKYFQKNYTSSLREIQLARRLNPTNQIYDIYLAGDEIKLGWPAKAVEASLNQMVKLHPESARSFLSASNLYFLQYTQTSSPLALAQAKTSIIQALRIDPLYAERYTQLSFYDLLDNNLPEALDLVKLTVSLKSDDFLAWVLMAKIYQLQDRTPQAVYALNQALKVEPLNPQVKLWLELAKQRKDIKKVPISLSLQNAQLE